MSHIPSFPSYEPLHSPFDVALAPQAFDTSDAPSQEVAMASALLAPHTAIASNTAERFFSERVRPIQLNKLRQLYQEDRRKSAIALLTGRHTIAYHGGAFTANKQDPLLVWSADETYIDLVIYVGRGLGLGALLPNVHVHHNFEFRMDLTKPYRTFTAKYAQLGFDPKGSVLWIGCSPASEDVWLSFIPWNMGDTDAEEIRIRPGESSGNSTLGIIRYRRVVMFLATMVKNIAYLDITVDDEYPDVSDDTDFKFATNILCVLLLLLDLSFVLSKMAAGQQSRTCGYFAIIKQPRVAALSRLARLYD